MFRITGGRQPGPERQDKVSKTRSKENKTEEPLLSYLKMELPAAGEHVFAVESIEKKRSRKVCHMEI